MSSSNNERESFWKSPILKSREYDLWAQEMQTLVRSIDGECWKIITEGDLVVTMADSKPVPFNLYTAEDYTKDEKNNKALKLVTSGLSKSNRRKVLGSATAKDKWDALARSIKGRRMSRGMGSRLFSRITTTLRWEKRRVSRTFNRGS